METLAVPIVPEGGNTITPSVKQISPAKRWCFTLNNPTEEERSSIVLKLEELSTLYIIGDEVGESGTPHLQGYVEFSKKIRPVVPIGITGVHWEKVRGTRNDNITYCRKDGLIVAEKGVPPAPKAVVLIDPTYVWERFLLGKLTLPIHDRHIYWFFSTEEHGVGKTSFCKYLIVKHNAIVLGGSTHNQMNAIVEYAKEHNGCLPELVVVNHVKDQSKVNYRGLETIKDMMFYSGKYEGGMVCGNCCRLWVFANCEPEWFRLTGDRLQVYEIGKDTMVKRTGGDDES